MGCSQHLKDTSFRLYIRKTTTTSINVSGISIYTPYFSLVYHISEMSAVIGKIWRIEIMILETPLIVLILKKQCTIFFFLYHAIKTCLYVFPWFCYIWYLYYVYFKAYTAVIIIYIECVCIHTYFISSKLMKFR